MTEQYIVRCPVGLAKIAILELKYNKVIERNYRPFILFERNYDFIFLNNKLKDKPKNNLRIAEDIYECIIFGKYQITKNQIEKVSKKLEKDKKYKLVATADGKYFDRRDIKRWFEKQLIQKGIKLSEDGEEIWLFLIDESFYLGKKMFAKKEIKERDFRIQEREGSLPQNIAAAMAFLAQAQNGESLLDPVCGSGTILAELASYNPNLKIYGVDIDKEAIKLAKENTKKFKNIEIKEGDSTNSSFENKSIDKVVGNLPFGKQFGSKEENPQLYYDLLEDFIRITKDNSKIILLTSDTESLTSAINKFKELKLENEYLIKVRGESAEIFVLSKVC